MAVGLSGQVVQRPPGPSLVMLGRQQGHVMPESELSYSTAFTAYALAAK